jgi:hypothetical protein
MKDLAPAIRYTKTVFSKNAFYLGFHA